MVVNRWLVTALLLASCCTAFNNDDQLARDINHARADRSSLSGVAVVGMTYLVKFIPALAFSMGLYISGNSIGGMVVA